MTILFLILFFLFSGWMNTAGAQTTVATLNNIRPFLAADFATNCETKLDALIEAIKKNNVAETSNETLAAEGSSILRTSWDLRLKLHAVLPHIDKSCTLKIRDVFHQIRDTEDYVGEILYKKNPRDPRHVDFQKEAIPIYDRAAYPPFLVKGGLDLPQFEFKSGDVILARGISFFSAIITKLSNNRSHFSHSFVLDVNPETGKIRSVESYVGENVQSYDINHALRNENVRLMVLRPRDPALGAVAANFAMELAQRKVRYDYKMDFEDDSEMSCVEVPVYSYKKASNGQMHIPLYPAQVEHRNEKFLKSLGVKKGSFITPDDLETDPRFELVLDWSDPNLIRDSRYKDAVLAEVVRWSDQLGYQFHESFKTFLATRVLLPLRNTFLAPALAWIPFIPKVDAHIPPETLSAMTALDEVSQKLLDVIKSQDLEFFQQNNRPLTNQQLRENLEKIRSDDLSKHQNKKKSLFHSIFRPDV
jgi:hypothetical protein